MHHGEKLNTFTHLTGAALSIAGLSILATLAYVKSDWLKMASFCVYGATLVLLYCSSALYHGVNRATHPGLKRTFQKLDHAAIYLLIAGSYTPIALLALQGGWRIAILALAWGMAILGIAQEFTLGRKGRRTRLSLAIYLAMGFLALVAAKPLWMALPAGATAWLLGAGAAYTSGIYFFVNDKRPHFHGIWHVFVMAGSISHYICMVAYFA